ncbi:hypothetical protein CesoFtcFv8_013233 [Champsocephalus esox]|uniref:Uncharacterized protein n=2 Tax=Champsocephalus TaxID=52236 RepID=A0AAN8DJ49_CHAGU|nr:hypothetical protein CesoFtcFv8_013233 [Champsocephalus esox]KAK5922840.1 hypothetical protein CgunFtcFv8_020071 [Champsocephalus gunnari]
MITFIISHNDHSCRSCDVIRSGRCVPESDVRLHPMKSPPTGAQAGPTPHQPSSPLCIPSPSPVAYVQTGSISAPASFSSQLDYALSPPRIV